MTQIGLPHRRQPLKGNSAESVRCRAQLTTNIRRHMVNAGYSWHTLADATGLTKDRMASIQESVADVRAIELCVLAKTLGVNVDELVKGCVE